MNGFSKLIPIFLFVFTAFSSLAQDYRYQYFDGDDTTASSSILIELDPDSTNIWQIGPPQKVIFDSAATMPNALITDTINYYPVNNTSRFWFEYVKEGFWMSGVFAIQWKQKLDFEFNHDGGMIEYSLDTGVTWENVFNNPYVYNFYGFEPGNKDTLITGEFAFSGRDTLWRDIWLCFDASLVDTILLRFTMKSDSVNDSKEGWMIDNMMMHFTYIHSVNQEVQKDYLEVYPTITSGIVYIRAQKLMEYHIIESMDLINAEGKVVERFGKSPTKFYIDIGNHPPGIYYLTVRTNFRSMTFPLALQKP